MVSADKPFITICNNYVLHAYILFFLLGLPFYDSSKDFTCFDGSLTVPFNSVNDDYCDCADGSDEPGMVAISIFCQMV